MAKIVVRKFRELDELDLFLSGAVIAGDASGWGKAIATGGNALNMNPVLAGLTLVFTSPASHTVTFAAGADPAGRLQFSEFKAQVQAVMTTLNVRQFQGRIVFVESTPTSGVSISAAGTANTALGIDTAAASTGTVYGSPFAGTPPTAPYFLQAYSTNDNMHVLYTFE